MKFIFTLLFSFASVVYGQTTLKGIVLGNSDHLPIPYATVYINGTTIGTITDINGHFTLKNVLTPCQLVVSHVSFLSQMIPIVDDNPKDLRIILEPNIISVSEVQVMDKNLREKNLNTFKKVFLGTDYFGQRSILKNDSVLIFTRDTLPEKSIKNENSSQNSPFDFSKKQSTLKAMAIAPLIVDNPQLGYKIQVNLVNFTVHFFDNYRQSSYDGYYYLQPYESIPKFKQKKYARNRKRAYYNSGLHFLRSLFDGTLARNGYELKEEDVDTVTNKHFYYPADISQNINYIDERQMEITGLKSKHLVIFYYRHSDGTPRSLIPKKKTVLRDMSRIYFLSDTCTVFKGGIVFDNSIMFQGSIPKKQIGAFIPNNYRPDSSEKMKSF